MIFGSVGFYENHWSQLSQWLINFTGEIYPLNRQKWSVDEQTNFLLLILLILWSARSSSCSSISVGINDERNDEYNLLPKTNVFAVRPVLVGALNVLLMFHPSIKYEWEILIISPVLLNLVVST